MYAANEILFPAHVIPELRSSRGAKWRDLIDHVLTLPQTHEEVLAFMLMMVRLNGCMECETDSYRAMRGCNLCALQTLRRYKGSDDQLLAIYQENLNTIRDYLARTGYKNRLQAVLELI